MFAVFYRLDDALGFLKPAPTRSSEGLPVVNTHEHLNDADEGVELTLREIQPLNAINVCHNKKLRTRTLMYYGNLMANASVSVPICYQIF